jgi:hypothetical protein
MKVIIAWWKLDNSDQTIDSLRQHLKKEGIDAWKSIDGMYLKFWISDRENNLWGAVILWETAHYMNQQLPPNLAAQLIGYPPTLRFSFDLEASIEGKYMHPFLNKLGLCFEEG